MKKYKKYSALDFLEDDFFRESVLYPTKDSDRFWTYMISNNLIILSEYEEATAILKNLILDNSSEIFPKDSQNLWNRIQTSTYNHKHRKIIHKYIYIASSIACILVAILFYNNLFKSQEDIMRQMANAEISHSIDTLSSIQLVMATQTIDLVGNDASVNYKSADSISINDKQLEKDKSTYNQIIVPYGKRSDLVLDDGSHIWINAGSHIIYPSKFSDSKRSIFVKGEVYAEIAKDSKRPFQIVTDHLDIEVLGTSFNISDYASDNMHSVVLVEGSVKVKSNTSGNKTSILKPNEMFSSTAQETAITIVDASKYTAWKDGLYHFKNKPLSEVLNTINRYYNVEIECSQDASAVSCTGSIDLKDDVDQIIKGIVYATSLDFEKTDNKFRIF